MRDANHKIVELEEELFGSKTTCAELIESLKKAEDEHEETMEQKNNLETKLKEM